MTDRQAFAVSGVATLTVALLLGAALWTRGEPPTSPPDPAGLRNPYAWSAADEMPSAQARPDETHDGRSHDEDEHGENDHKESEGGHEDHEGE